ncbi:MAG: carboxylate-amine ligase, partial [Cyanobacteria bacterium J083]
LSEFGKVGLTSIGDSLTEAEEIYAKVESVLKAETNINLQEQELRVLSPLPITWHRE